MSKYVWMTVAALVVVGGLWWWMSSSQNAPAPSASPTASPSPTAGANGRVILKVTDPGTSVLGATSIMLTVDKVEAHMASASWMTVSTASKQYDLIQLKDAGVSKLLADVNLAAGTYDQIRLNISKVEVTVAGKVYQAKLPSHTLKLVGPLTVTGGETTVASLDFVAEKSLHLTGSGMYILTPVVKFQVQDNANASIDADEKVTVTGGTTETDKTEGMDESGEMRENFELKGTFKVDANGMIHVTK